MLIVILLVLIAFSVVFFKMSAGDRTYAKLKDFCLGLGILFGIIAFVVVIIGGVNIIRVSNISSLNRKIELYEKENDEHIKVLKEIVGKYVSRQENDRYADLIGENPIIALSLISDFNVDTHTNWRLRSYQNNRTKILECKERIIDLELIRKLYFFGI